MKKLLPILLLALLLSTCQGIQIKKKPTATIANFDIESISLHDITLIFDIEIGNPYPVGLKLDDIGFTFYIENKQFLKTSTAKGLKIAAMDKKISSFTVNLKYTDIIKIVQDYTNKDYLDCVVDTVISIPLPDIPGLEKNITLTYKLKKQIPAIKPSIKIANFHVQMPTEKDIADALKKSGKSLANSDKIYGMFEDILSGKKPQQVIDPASLDLKLKVSFDIEMKNETRAKLNFKRLDYNFLVNGSKLVDGSTTDIKNDGNKSILKIITEFSTKTMSKSILKAFQNKNGDYGLQGEAQMELPPSVKKTPLKLKFDETGRFNL
ncbi:MAG: hypothetical protein CVV44_00110 [Spirochaetae bacterium HGW-Spirochaetae-1]|nr:MAG: hypothetical protein CVV44_00110 [Spirochaetae bacterium HGW-Spirochaetae-1]